MAADPERLISDLKAGRWAERLSDEQQGNWLEDARDSAALRDREQSSERRQRVAGEVLALRRSIASGEAGLMQVRRAEREGRFSPEQIASLKQDVEQAEVRAQILQAAQDEYEIALISAIGFDAENEAHRQTAENFYVATFRKAVRSGADAATQERLADAVTRTGYVAKGLAQDLTAGLESDDPGRRVAAAQLYGHLLEAAPDLLPQFLEPKVRARGGVLNRWLDAGLPPEEALRRAEMELPSDGKVPLLSEEEMAALKLETKHRLKGEESQSTVHRVVAQLEDLFLNELGAGQNIRTARNAVRRELLRQTLTDVNPENSLTLSNSDQSRSLSFTTAQMDDVGSNVGDLRVETQRDGSLEDDTLVEATAGLFAGSAIFQRAGRDGQAFSGFSVAANDLKSKIADGTGGAYDEFGVVDFGRKSRPQRSRLEIAERLEKALYNSLYEDRLHPAQDDPGRRAIAAKKQARAIAAMDQALAERLSDAIVGKSAQPRVMTPAAFERKYGAIIAAGNIDIAANVKDAQNLSPIGFINKFLPGKEWDYSERDVLNRAGFSKKQLSDFGNVHFGIMANAYGFRLGQSLYGAGFVQVHIQGIGAPGELHLATGLMLETEGGRFLDNVVARGLTGVGFGWGDTPLDSRLVAAGWDYGERNFSKD